MTGAADRVEALAVVGGILEVGHGALQGVNGGRFALPPV
ncbi:Uncharacterized protein PAT23_p0024 (plasmid) [Pseudomonas aeruginosa]|nr:Uncharacterized protein PAT23_p0024 [Pseudomonas aeruginosa]QEO33969.1 Uncharacterized protein PAT169_p0024 [Pseudomonas aeruginosa]